MNLADLLKKNIVMVPVVASVLVGTFTGVKYIVNLTDTINGNKAQIEKIQSVDKDFAGIIINPAAYTHTSIALLDALRALSKPKVEIHLSNIYTREDYRKKSITSEGVNGLICGFGENSYILAIEAINNLIYK